MASSAEASSNTFEHEPLDPSKEEIRIIRFVTREKHFREGFSPPLEVQLKHISLQSCPRYHALSYVWGSWEKPDLKLFNGKGIYVTRSVYEALLRFNLDKSVEFLWADALCIHQTDLVEQSIQVRRMRQI